MSESLLQNYNIQDRLLHSKLDQRLDKDEQLNREAVTGALGEQEGEGEDQVGESPL